MNRGYIVGAGAHGRIIAEVWRAQYPSISLCFLDDDPALQQRSILGITVVGTLETLKTVGGAASVVLAIGNNLTRLKLAAIWGPQGIVWEKVVHPSATVMSSATLGGGTMVLAHALVNSGAQIGQHVIVNSGAIVEHDAVLADGCQLAPGVCMGGRVEIGRGAFISTGVTIAPRVRIGAGSVVGAGAAVVKDIPAGVLAYGVPARVIRPLGDEFNFARLL